MGSNRSTLASLSLEDAPRGGRLLLCGDWHGARHSLILLEQAVAESGCDVVVQLGDFGYYPRTKWGQEYLGALRRLAERLEIRVYFIDGNHEDHESLASLARSGDGAARAAGPVWYLPRGTRFSWNGRSIGVLGGARSVIGRRSIGEDLLPSDVLRLGAEPLDVLFSHDAPEGVYLPGAPEDMLEAEDMLAAEQQRRLLARSVADTGCSFVAHGHWHLRRSHEVLIGRDVVRVESMAHERAGRGNWSVLDLAQLAVEPLV